NSGCWEFLAADCYRLVCGSSRYVGLAPISPWSVSSRPRRTNNLPCLKLRSISSWTYGSIAATGTTGDARTAIFRRSRVFLLRTRLHCGFTITPDLVKRVDFGRIECPNCGENFLAQLDRDCRTGSARAAAVVVNT